MQANKIALAAALAVVVLSSTPSVAQSDTQIRNAISDSARYQRDQAESLRSIERIQRDQARRDDQDRINAQRDARSMRRFDR